jgi:aspartate kinase
VFQVLAAEGINMQMLSQGSSKTNISMVVDGAQAQRVVQLLHREFFEQQGNPEHN